MLKVPMKISGLVIIAILLVIPLIWIPGLLHHSAVAVISQLIGIWALITMAMGQILATRFKWVESVFGGLDQVYVLHKWLGIAAVALILLHDTIDADIDGLPGNRMFEEIGDTLGEISLYGILILVVITVATFIPYHLWRWTHRFIGVFFVLGALHYLMIIKPFSNLDPLGLYVGSICIAGILAFVWRSLPAAFKPSHPYTISNVEKFNSATAISLKPTKKGLKHRAGQFINVSIADDESHPFTVSCAPQDDRTLRVSIGVLGDHTNQLRKSISVDQTVRVEGPHGRFFPSKSNSRVWVAAGIGITPFLAWAEAMKPDDPKTELVYCIKNRATATHLPELEQIVSNRENLSLTVWESQSKGRLTTPALTDLVSEIATGSVAFCGPVAMRKSLQNDLSKAGLPPKQFHYEDFEFRTGIGLEALSQWVWSRMQKARAAKRLHDA